MSDRVKSILIFTEILKTMKDNAMSTLSRKEKIDIIGKKIDITKSKTLVFLATGGSSWIYAVKASIPELLVFGAWAMFAMSVFGTVVNVVRFGQLYKNLERIENDNI